MVAPSALATAAPSASPPPPRRVAGARQEGFHGAGPARVPDRVRLWRPRALGHPVGGTLRRGDCEADDRRELEALGGWEKPDEFERKFVKGLPGGRLLHVEGASTASVHPYGGPGIVEVAVADQARPTRRGHGLLGPGALGRSGGRSRGGGRHGGTVAFRVAPVARSVRHDAERADPGRGGQARSGTIPGVAHVEAGRVGGDRRVSGRPPPPTTGSIARSARPCPRRRSHRCRARCRDRRPRVGGRRG